MGKGHDRLGHSGTVSSGSSSHLLAVVLRHREEFLLNPQSRPEGRTPFLLPIPSPQEGSIEDAEHQLSLFLGKLGLDVEREKISRTIVPEAATMRPIGHAVFALAIVDIPADHFRRLRARFPVLPISEILRQASTNMFFASIASEYRGS